MAETYEDLFPKDLGPPPVPNYSGKKLHDTTKPTYTVELDNGAFQAVWELLEAEARRRFPVRSTMAFSRAYLRAVEAFRQTYWSSHEPPEQKPVRKLVRRSRP
jgi:hypothetical protein